MRFDEYKKRSKSMAEWCILTGMRPEDYRRLTITELEAFAEAAARKPRLF